MKKSTRLLSSVSELLLIGFGMAFFFSPHLKVNTYYFPVAIVTVLFIIQFIIRNNLLGLALGMLTAPVFILLMLGNTPRIYKYTRLLGEPSWVYAAHVLGLLVCLMASIWIIRKYLLLYYRRLRNQSV